MTEITHERCSELLRSLEWGGLGASEAAAVNAHLASCDECAREQAGLKLLVGGRDPLLSADEKERLHNAIHAAIADERPRRAARAPSAPTALRRLAWPTARVLAAAAVIVAGFVFATNVFPGGDGETAGPARQSVSGGGAGGGAAARDADGPGPVFAVPTGQTAFTTEQAEGAAAEDSPGPEQALRAAAMPAPPYSLKDLNQLARGHRPFTEFAAAYTAEDAQPLSQSFLDRLAASAPNDDVSSAVRECGADVLSESPGPILPAFAAYDLVRGTRSLILGFVIPNGASGPLNHFSIWVYPDADCGVMSYSSSGSISPGG